MGYQDVGFRGSDIKTPNIDKLAKQGVILQNHYVLELCAPSRGSLMTGRYPIRTGYWKGNADSKRNLGLEEEFGLASKGLQGTSLAREKYMLR